MVLVLVPEPVLVLEVVVLVVLVGSGSGVRTTQKIKEPNTVRTSHSYTLPCNHRVLLIIRCTNRSPTSYRYQLSLLIFTGGLPPQVFVV